MDGVVADFDEYAARTLGIPPSSGIYPNEIWYKLASNAYGKKTHRLDVICRKSKNC